VDEESGSLEAQGAARIQTFLIADIRGYTLFTQERGDEAAGKLAARFARIAREVVQHRGGSVIELRGDEAVAVFASARQAVAAAVDLQERLADETIVRSPWWPSSGRSRAALRSRSPSGTRRRRGGWPVPADLRGLQHAAGSPHPAGSGSLRAQRGKALDGRRSLRGGGVCPRCVARPIEHKETGWCIECASQHTVEAYREREAAAVDKRRRNWVRRSQLLESPAALRERQRKHRLYADIDTQGRPDASIDPWELGFEGLRHLERIRGAALKSPHGQEHFEAVQEIIRQLATGPEGLIPDR
jgi:hypothetical protein